MHSTTLDMTKGSPWKLIVGFALPVLLSQIFQQLYNTADTLIVGRYLGDEALAAADYVTASVDDDGIRHKRTGVNVGFGSQTGRRLFLDGAAKNIARGDLRDAKLLAHANSLGALARTRRAEKNHVHAQVPHADPVINPGSPCDDA